MDTKPGYKLDNGKAPMDLLPWPALDEVASVMGFGATKYGVDNWRKGMRWGRVAAAAFRHLSAWMCGFDKDKETGYSHLAHAACCILFLLTYERYKIGEDDRPKWELRYLKEPPQVSNSVSLGITDDPESITPNQEP